MVDIRISELPAATSVAATDLFEVSQGGSPYTSRKATGTQVQSFVLGSYAGATSITTLGTISTGTWQGTAVAVAYGGTGATTAAAARTNLGLAIGTDVQAYDAELAAIAALSVAGLISRTGAGTAAARTLTGTTDRVTVTNGDGAAGNPTVDVASTYAGQTSITTVGTIGTGTWQGSIIAGAYGGTGNGFFAVSGPATSLKTFTFPNASATVLTDSAVVTGAQGGTGVANTGKTITLGGNFATSGAYALTLTLTAATSVTLPTTGTLATLANVETLTSKTLKSQSVQYFNSGTTSALDYTNGSHQRWAPTGTVTLSVTNWPASGVLGELLIEGINLGGATITWPTINWIKSDGTTTTTFASNGVTLQSSGTDWVFLWTRDGGTTVYGKIVR